MAFFLKSRYVTFQISTKLEESLKMPVYTFNVWVYSMPNFHPASFYFEQNQFPEFCNKFKQNFTRNLFIDTQLIEWVLPL